MSSWHHHDIKLASNNSHRFVHSVKTTADGPHLIRLSCSPSPTATARYLPHELRNWINEFTARLQIQFLDPRSDSIRSWGIKTLLSALPCPIIHCRRRGGTRIRLTCRTSLSRRRLGFGSAPRHRAPATSAFVCLQAPPCLVEGRMETSASHPIQSGRLWFGRLVSPQGSDLGRSYWVQRSRLDLSGVKSSAWICVSWTFAR
jgi:hypothetical protein